MNKCIICGEDSGKGITCGSTCRSRYNRRRRSVASGVANATVEPESVATVDDMFCEGVTWDDIDNLPIGVSRPTCRPDGKANGPDWWNEPEYAQVIARLLSHTVDELEAMSIWIPVWKYNSEAA